MPTKILIFLFSIISTLSWAETTVDMLQFKFQTKEESAQYLSLKDSYIENLSVLDLSLYHSTKETISILEHLDFLKTTTLDWTDEEKEKLNQMIVNFKETVSKLALKVTFPDEVKLIKTNGQDAFNSHYTRGDAIIFPASNNLIATDLATFYHEMFHIFSRFHPEKSDELYSLIGFKRIPRLQIPSDFEKMRTTNPDAFYYEHSLTIKKLDQEFEVVPVMYSAITQDQINGPVNEAAVYRLGLFDLNSFQSTKRIFFKVADTNYKEVVKANTHYYIHPEEIMAEDFKLLLLQNTKDEKAPTVRYQEVIDQLKELLTR